MTISAQKNYKAAKEKLVEATTKENMPDDVIYLAADTFCEAYRHLDKVDSSKLSKLMPGGTIDKFVAGEIGFNGVLDNLMTELVHEGLVKIFTDTLDSDCDCDDCDCEEEQIVERNEDGDIIFQAKFAASRTFPRYMEVFLDVWAGDGADDLTEEQLRKKVKKTVRKLICEGNEEHADLLHVKTKFVDDPLFDLDAETHLCD